MASRGLFSIMSARTRRSLTLLWAALFLCSLLMQYMSFSSPASVLAALTVNLDQYANSDDEWQNGDLNGNNSAWNEGDVVPFRLAIEGLDTTLTEHTIDISYDFTAGGHKAYDFLATWDVTESPGECDAGGGGVSSLCDTGLGTADTETFPDDTRTVDGLPATGAYGSTPRELTLYGGTIVDISGPVCEGDTDANSTCVYTVTFTTTGEAALFLWGGHLAESFYWNGEGDPDGAAQVSGAPWHMRTQQLDGAGNKNQDRSIQPSAIIKTAPTIATQVKNNANDANIANNGHVAIGTVAYDTATLSGVTSNAGGTVQYYVEKGDDACSVAGATSLGSKTVTDTVVPKSDTFTFTSAGTYYFWAVYSGDSRNNGATSGCATEIVIVDKNTTTTTTVVMNTNGTVDKANDTAVADGGSVIIGTTVYDTATIGGETGTAGGSVTYNLYGNDSCTGTALLTSGPHTVTNGAVPDSDTYTFAAAGTYGWQAVYTGDANNTGSTSACGTETVVVSLNTTTITTQVKNDANDANIADGATVAIGTAVYDTATIGGETATAGGSVTYNLYANDACTGTPLFTSGPHTVTNGIVPDSNPFTFTAAGTYGWQAVYTGDGNNAGSTSTCGTETVVVGLNSPTVVTTASAGITLGGTISDSAVLAGATAGATGNIVFNLYGPNDATCSGAVIFTATVPVSGNGTYGSGSFTPTAAGTYRWIANYSGDSNNSPTSNLCNAANENVVVSPKSPQITTDLVGGGTHGATLTLPLGTSVNDTATITGATANAGGTVTYTVYTNNTCTTGAQSAGTVTVTNGIVPNSNAIVFNSAGTFYWQAAYSGDANNNPATSACTSEVLTITPNAVAINTLLSGQGQTGTAITIQIGNSVTDGSTLTGETATAGGTVTYTVYSNDTCTTGAQAAGTVTVTNGNVPNSNAITFNSAGTFYWQAVYSGDANNVGATSPCTAEVVTVIVPGINIVKTVNDTDKIVGPGQELTYTLQLSVVNGPMTQSVVSDPLPVGQTFKSASDGGTYNATTRTITWNLGTLQSGNRTLTYVVTVDANAASGDQTNVATFDTNETPPDTDDETVRVPALTVLKAVAGNTAGSIGGTPQAKQGDTLTFTLTYDITNGPVTGGVITDVLPLGYTYVANSATASTPGGEFTFVSFTAATRTLRWTAANATQDGSVTYQATVAVGAAELPQPLINVAVIDSNETNPDDDDQPVLVQEPPAPATATPRITPPPTDLSEQTPSNPGFGLMLALLGLAGFVLAIGYMTPVPARARRRNRR